VTLDEIIHFRENHEQTQARAQTAHLTQVHSSLARPLCWHDACTQAAKDSFERVDLPLLEMKQAHATRVGPLYPTFLDPSLGQVANSAVCPLAQTDISRSLVALYHFDVGLDGHLTFEEFLLLQVLADAGCAIDSLLRIVQAARSSEILSRSAGLPSAGRSPRQWQVLLVHPTILGQISCA
jgi:hypothetical protein